MLAIQAILAIIMFVLMTLLFGYNLIACQLSLISFVCFSVIWVLSYKLLKMSVAEYKEVVSNSKQKRYGK